MKKSMSYIAAAIFALALLTGCRGKAPAATTPPVSPHTPTVTQGVIPTVMPEPTPETLPSPEITGEESVLPPVATPKA